MRKSWMVIGLLVALGVTFLSCKEDESNEGNDELTCSEGDIPTTESGIPYVAKVLALENFETVFAGDADEAAEQFETMASLGVTDMLMLEPDFDRDYIQEALKESNINGWMISQIFFNNSFYTDNIGKDDPMWAIKENGDVAWDEESGGWLRMACPNNGPEFDEDNPEDGFRQKTIKRIVDLVEKHEPYGVSLDFIRYYTYWEGVAEDADADSLEDTCFCDRCLALFQEEADVTIPDDLDDVQAKADWIHENEQDAWTEFKTNTITGFVKEVVEAVHDVNSDVKINLHAVPWKQNEYDGAVTRIAGQDFKALEPHLDWLSPMTYAGMKDREASWVGDVVADMADTVDTSKVGIVPAIQVAPMGGSTPTPQEVEDQLESSVENNAAAIAFWPWETITEDQQSVLEDTLLEACE